MSATLRPVERDWMGEYLSARLPCTLAGSTAFSEYRGTIGSFCSRASLIASGCLSGGYPWITGNRRIEDRRRARTSLADCPVGAEVPLSDLDQVARWRPACPHREHPSWTGSGRRCRGRPAGPRPAGRETLPALRLTPISWAVATSSAIIPVAVSGRQCPSDARSEGSDHDILHGYRDGQGRLVFSHHCSHGYSVIRGGPALARWVNSDSACPPDEQHPCARRHARGPGPQLQCHLDLSPDDGLQMVFEAVHPS